MNNRADISLLGALVINMGLVLLYLLNSLIIGHPCKYLINFTNLVHSSLHNFLGSCKLIQSWKNYSESIIICGLNKRPRASIWPPFLNFLDASL